VSFVDISIVISFYPDILGYCYDFIYLNSWIYPSYFFDGYIEHASYITNDTSLFRTKKLFHTRIFILEIYPM
jgi:hypothetical protein